MCKKLTLSCCLKISSEDCTMNGFISVETCGTVFYFFESELFMAEWGHYTGPFSFCENDLPLSSFKKNQLLLSKSKCHFMYYKKCEVFC